jgi:hypothetical protein
MSNCCNFKAQQILNPECRPNKLPTIVVIAPITGVDAPAAALVYPSVTYSNVVNWNVIVEDDQSDTTVFVQIVQRYLNLGVKYFVGGYTSTEVAAWIANFADADAWFITGASTAVLNFRPNNLIRLQSNDTTSSIVIANYIKALGLVGTVGILAIDSIYGHSLSSELQKVLQIDFIKFYTPANVTSVAQQAYALVPNSPDILIVLSTSQRTAILNQRSGCTSIVAEAAYTNEILAFGDTHRKILATCYTGAGLNRNPRRKDFQTDFFAISGGIYATYTETGIIGALQFLDYVVNPTVPLADIPTLMQSYFSVTGNLLLDANLDRNNDAATIATVKTLGNQLVWEEIQQHVLDNTIYYGNGQQTKSITSYPILDEIAYTFIPATTFDTITYVNFNGMTYVLTNTSSSAVPPVTNMWQIEYLSDKFRVIVPPIVTNGSVTATIIEDDSIVTQQVVDGPNRVIDL